MYKEEKSRRVGRKGSTKRDAEELSRPEKRTIGNRPSLPRPVDVIAEDDEEPASALISPTTGRVLPPNSPPRRADTSQLDVNARTRAISTSQVQTGTTQILPRKTSSLSARASIPIAQKRSVQGPTPLEFSGKPNRAGRIQRDISDMDLDDVVYGSDGEKSEARTPSSYRSSRPPRISKSARELIDFLDQGPPADFAPPLPPQSQVTPSTKSAGRFQRIMSRLTGGSSNEKLREEGAKLRKTPVSNTVSHATNGTTSLPQTPVRKGPAVIVATPPPRMQPMTQQITPPNSPPTVIQDSSRPVQRRTSVRKKVPPLDPGLEMSGPNPQSPVSRTVSTSSELPRPSVLINGKGQTNGVNEVRKPASPPSSSPEPEPRTRRSADTIASGDSIVFQRSAPTPPKIAVEVVAPASVPTPASLPATVHPSSPPQSTELSLNVVHAQNLRELMSMATTADECRVLVDMFLARVGFPVDRSANENPYPSPISSADPSDVDLESSVIETLLGGGSSSGTSTATQSPQLSEVGQESEVETSDAGTCDDAIGSPDCRSPSRITRDTRLNHPPPLASRLLAVA